MREKNNSLRRGWLLAGWLGCVYIMLRIQSYLFLASSLKVVIVL